MVKIADYEFEGYYKDTNSLQDKSGVYVILCYRNNEYYVTDVGESGEVKTRVENHDRADCWKKNCSGSRVYAVKYTPNAKQEERKIIEKNIREKYDPPCGKE